MKKAECIFFITLSYIFLIPNWGYVGNHTVAFWKGRYSLILQKKL
jgi:hypothetical protein